MGAAPGKGDAKQLLVLNGPGIGPSIPLFTKGPPKAHAVTSTWLKGKCFMDREEIASSSEFILYDSAYLEATSL